MIDFKNVTKAYPNGTVALRRVNIHIDDGEFVFIVGRSGAGKTTMMKLLLREEKITDGQLIVNDFNLARLSSFKVPYYRRRLGVVFQDFRLFQNKNVYENVAFAMRVIGTPPKMIRRRVPAILKTVNLGDKLRNFPRELSGGEQQRVVLARALANNPDFIIADEPTGNIDPEMSLDIMNLLLKINKFGKTVIVVTHEDTLVDYFKQRVITLDDGNIVSDIPASVKAPPSKRSIYDTGSFTKVQTPSETSGAANRSPAVKPRPAAPETDADKDVDGGGK